jgi:hypothetical protein
MCWISKFELLSELPAAAFLYCRSGRKLAETVLLIDHEIRLNDGEIFKMLPAEGSKQETSIFNNWCEAFELPYLHYPEPHGHILGRSGSGLVLSWYNDYKMLICLCQNYRKKWTLRSKEGMCRKLPKKYHPDHISNFSHIGSVWGAILYQAAHNPIKYWTKINDKLYRKPFSQRLRYFQEEPNESSESLKWKRTDPYPITLQKWTGNGCSFYRCSLRRYTTLSNDSLHIEWFERWT